METLCPSQSKICFTPFPSYAYKRLTKILVMQNVYSQSQPTHLLAVQINGDFIKMDVLNVY